jgi:hypothetical protein
MTDINQSEYTQPKEVSAIAWSYLDTVTLAFKVLLDAQSEYSKIFSKKVHKFVINESKQNFASKLHLFYLSTASNFEAYLVSDDFKKRFKDTKVTPEDYQELHKGKIDGDKLFSMTRIICVWAQSTGPFATNNEVRDMGTAFQRGLKNGRRR